MRKQIAAANWKMNKTIEEGIALIKEIMHSQIHVHEGNEVLFAVPYPYLSTIKELISGKENMFIAAQNCHHKKNGAYTGEVSVDMLSSVGIKHCLVGHSERREYFAESNQVIAQKVDLCLEAGITPVFCCGEPLEIRDLSSQNQYVTNQLNESLFHLSADDIKKVVIAYEPIWAIGTGRTASSEQAQEMHAHIRSVLDSTYGSAVANEISILYGGSVKGSNANELFSMQDVDGGLVGGASLVATEFVQIINSLKK
jgi:triosephosphate isomerase